MTALSVRGLVKRYDGGFLALDRLDLDIPDGSLFGLLGPNGAGKTTLIGSICNLVRPTDGSIEIFGLPHESRAARQLVGLAEQEINVDRFLSIRQALIYHGGYFGLGRRDAAARADEALELLGLASKSKQSVGDLSGGMQRRLVLARALLHRPRLLILDEPTAGVDVDLRSEIWHLVRTLNAAGTTILLTTHYLEEAESLCDEIALIRQGRIVDRGTSGDLRLRYEVDTIAALYDRVIREPVAS
ncbi:ABC transporter ATP-binding protein [Nocardioides sp. Kera G14]|uniref:ABC transporter ATP-binding protein n=1 Tax=Nocardioides sp. Kera G14 TaxID=2884264 RepID=UPI001D12156F|nr:ABC transporter ATP-binding protein [Nocardioides sp. Kera G14]UDY23051.1 ABC transporter ATP-binding protein [Nocardioides sp. Kera G14]